MANTNLVQESTMQTLLSNVERLAAAQQAYLDKYGPGYNIVLHQDEDGFIILEPGDPSEDDSEISLQAKTNISPSESSQTIYPDTGYYGLSSVQINAIANNYIGSAVTRKAAATYTPGTSNQTIAAGQYLSGVQTISGDSNLVSSNIKSGVSIFGITGSYSGPTVPNASGVSF